MLAANCFTNPRLLSTASKSLGCPSSFVVNPFPLPLASNSCFSQSPVGRFGVKCTATKPPKSPAEEDWKVKREVLLQKKEPIEQLGDLLLPQLPLADWQKEVRLDEYKHGSFGYNSLFHSLPRVRSVEVKEALRLQMENNFLILDVRPEAEFKEAHAPGAINVQIYRLIKEWTPWDIARRTAFLFFGIVSGTEENPEFVQIVESRLDKDAKIIVACSSGGTMRPSQNLPQGQQSRSLIAAYLLVLNGYKNVYHLDGGLYNWFKEGLPSISEE